MADEALRRGITVEVLDAEGGFLRLTHGGRSLVTRESLSELTTAVAMSRRAHKRVTRRTLEGVGIQVPRAISLADGTSDEVAWAQEFLADVGEVVVKPAQGEQGNGVSVGITSDDAIGRAIAAAHAVSAGTGVLVEECIGGSDLRVLVIDHAVVAAALREPAAVVGDGRQSIRELIGVQSRRRAGATAGKRASRSTTTPARPWPVEAASSTTCRPTASASRSGAPPTCIPAARSTT